MFSLRCPASALLPGSQFSPEERSDNLTLDIFETVVNVIDYTLDTKKKRHIVSGVLLSVSMLFGGLAMTFMTMKLDEKDEKNESEDDIDE